MSGSEFTRFKRARARQLRAEQTSAEALLWAALDRVPIQGTHFRRQVPLGPYIADFACLGRRLVIELDGPSHTTTEGERKDRSRTAWLEAEGYRVLRFWNQEVYDNLDGVLETIWRALEPVTTTEVSTPPRPLRGRPSPSRGG